MIEVAHHIRFWYIYILLGTGWILDLEMDGTLFFFLILIDLIGFTNPGRDGKF